MPRYFFHVDNGEFIPDETGTDLPDLQAARREAVRAAGEMIDEAQESFWDHLKYVYSPRRRETARTGDGSGLSVKRIDRRH